MHRKKGKQVGLFYICMVLCMAVGIYMFSWGFGSSAAEGEIWLECVGEQLGAEYTMDRSAINLSLKSSGTQYDSEKYQIEWKIPIAADQQIIEFQLDGNESEDQKYTRRGSGAKFLDCVIKAKKPGTAEISVKVLDNTDEENPTIAQQTTLRINVAFAIDTSQDADYSKVFESDEKKTLFLYVDEMKEMKLNIGDSSTDVYWYSANEDVVSIITSTGGSVYAKAIGSGKTTITAEGFTKSDELTVCVVPKLSKVDGSGYSHEGTFNVHTGDYLYTDAIFKENKSQTIDDKMVWAIYKYNDNGINRELIEDSLGNKKSDLIELTTVSADQPANLKVTAKAGEYVIDFYTAGTYLSEGNIGNVPKRTSIKLNVCAEYGDREINLNTGDQFNLADALNITTEEFNSWFSVELYVKEDKTDKGYTSYLTYNSKTNLVETLKATEQIWITAEIVPTDIRKANALKGDAAKSTTSVYRFRIVDELLLNMRNVNIVVGEEMQLVVNAATYDGKLTWSSADEKYVTVSETGVIKGIAKTVQDVTVTVSQQMSDGSIKKAICKVKVEETIKEISLSDTYVEMLEGTVKTVSATFNPDRSEAPIQWITSDESVFTINVSTDKKSVVITAKKAGTAVLTAVNEHNYVTAACRVTVLSEISSIALPQEMMTVRLNREVIRMQATITPANASNNRLQWASSDPTVATVNDAGLVTLLKAGTTIITVKPEYNTTPPIMAQCILIVEQSSTGLTLGDGSITLENGDSKLLQYILAPANATTTVMWKSMDSAIATVSEKGLVTAKKAGTTYIIATSIDGYSASCKVTVTQRATGIKLSVTDLTIGVGDSFTVGRTIIPEDCTDKTVSWSSQNAKIATVNGDGKITGVAVGTAIVAAKIKSGEVAYVNVTVKDVLKGMTLSETEKTVAVGKSFSLTPVFQPENATNQRVTWSSSDSSIATVTATGKVTGIVGGTAMIICTSEDGGYTANCVVKVTEPVTEISLNHTSYQMTPNTTVKLKATVSSDTASNKKVKWTSSNQKVATVNSSGKVTAKKVGTCVIKAVAADGSGEYATCSIRVIKKVTTLKLSHSYVKIVEGKSKILKAIVSPKNATIKNVKWSSSDTEVALVNSKGKVFGVAEGVATISVETTDGSNIKATCTVSVQKSRPVTSMTVSASDITMVRGTTQSASVSISPTNTTDKITYSSDAKSVASVTSKGKIKAKRPGLATITISSSSGKEVYINVTVVGLNKTSLTLEQYDSDELWVEQVSDNVKWSSSNPSIARVENGTVVARRTGTCTITATVRGVKLQCKVKVIKIKS